MKVATNNEAEYFWLMRLLAELEVEFFPVSVPYCGIGLDVRRLICRTGRCRRRLGNFLFRCGWNGWNGDAVKSGLEKAACDYTVGGLETRQKRFEVGRPGNHGGDLWVSLGKRFKARVLKYQENIFVCSGTLRRIGGLIFDHRSNRRRHISGGFVNLNRRLKPKRGDEFTVGLVF